MVIQNFLLPIETKKKIRVEDSDILQLVHHCLFIFLLFFRRGDGATSTSIVHSKSNETYRSQE